MKILVVLALFACATAFRVPSAFKGSPHQFKWRIEPRFSDEDKIVGGSYASKNEFPFIISLRQKQSSSWWGSSYRHICGGSIISNNRVLTAAHCTVNFKASDLNVAAGQHRTGSDTDDNEQTSDISDAVECPRYSTVTLNNDFSVLKLARSFTLNDYVKKIGFSACDDYKPVTVAGWGATSEGGSAATTLKKLTVPVISNSECNKPYNGDITDSMICAGKLEGGEDSCQGDSGGPLFQGSGDNAKLVGVVSWGIGCARPNYPGVYARVTKEQSWINSV